MRAFTLLLTFIITALVIQAEAQSILNDKSNCYVTTQIKVNRPSVKNIEELKINIKIINNSDSTQRVLFDKPNRKRPWSTCGYLFNKAQEKITAVNCPDILSSSAYTLKELKDYFYYLNKGQTIDKDFRLVDLIWITKPLSPGKYKFYIYYSGNKSNVISFKLLD
jgi:hypothetical protein